MTAACEGYLQCHLPSSVPPAGPFLRGTQELLSHAAGQSKLLLDVLACPLPPDGPSSVWLQTRAKPTRYTADLAVSFCFLNSLLSLKLYLHPVRSCFWSHLVFSFAVKERDMSGPAREEFCQQRFSPAEGLMNHSMAMVPHPQKSHTP